MSDVFGKSRTVHTVRWTEVAEVLSSLNPSDFYASLHERRAIKSKIDSVAQEIRDWLAPAIDLSTFNHAYHVNGTHNSIEQWLATETRPIACLRGDYPYPRHLRASILVVDTVSDIPADCVVYMSNPFSSTGKFDDRYAAIHNPVILDCAYIGTTLPNRILVTDNTEQVFWSASKPFGLGNYRTGYRFCRTADLFQDQLKDTGYFNVFGIELLHRCLQLFSVFGAYNTLETEYVNICKEYALLPSDSFLIAHSDAIEYNHFAREDGVKRIPTGRLLDNKWRL